MVPNAMTFCGGHFTAILDPSVKVEFVLPTQMGGKHHHYYISTTTGAKGGLKRVLGRSQICCQVVLAFVNLLEDIKTITQICMLGGGDFIHYCNIYFLRIGCYVVRS